MAKGQIDREGTYRAKITSAGVGSTKNGFPQFVVQLTATQRYVEDPAEFAAFKIEEAGWVDWSAYDQEITGYFVLLGNDKTNPGAMKRLFNFDNVMRATGWDGASFAGLAGLPLEGKEVTVWVKYNEWQGVTSLKADLIDALDADPVRSIRTMDAEGLKGLDAQFGSLLESPKSKPVMAAKAVAKPSAPAPKAEAKPAPKPVPKPAPKVAPATEEAPFEGYADGEAGQSVAWESFFAKKGKLDDGAAADVWLSTLDEVAGKDTNPAEITGAQWAAIEKKALAKAS